MISIRAGCKVREWCIEMKFKWLRSTRYLRTIP